MHIYNTMNPFIFALVSYIGWGTGDIFGTAASRKIGGAATTFWTFLIGFVLFSLATPFMYSSLSGMTWPLFILNVVLGFLTVSGNVALNEAFMRSNASVVGTISASFAAIVVLFSVLFLGETVSPAQVVATVVIFSGVILCTLDVKELQTGTSKIDTGILLALYAAVSFATFFVFIKPVVHAVGWFWPNYISFFWFPCIYFYMRYRRIPLVGIKDMKTAAWILLSTALLRTADVVFNISVSLGLTTFVAPIAGSYPTLFVVLAFLVFRDQIKRQQVLGIICSLVGIVILSFTS